MLLHGVLKCYILYFLFVLCAAAKHQRVSSIDQRVRSLRRIGDENADNNSESDQPDTLAGSDDANDPKDDDGNDPKDDDGNDTQQSAPEDNEKNPPTEESKGNKDIPVDNDDDDGANQIVVPRFDLTDSSADKFLEINKLSAMTGFDYSPAEVEKFKIWPQGIIPFYIDEFSYDKILRDKIREYLDEANTMTGLRFLELPRPPAEDSHRWVFIINRRGQLECTDYDPKSFTNTGVQKLVIGYDCLGGARDIAPIVLALAGVPPQHNSPDRDKYIDVNTKSIQPDKVELFTAVKPEDWLFHDLQYDFLSAGHYPCHKYTTDGSSTIVPKSKISTFVGETEGLSYTDVLKIRLLYNFVVEKDDNNAKLQDCKALYRPGPKFKMNQKSEQNPLPARKKPKEYIEAAQRAGIEIVEGSESTPSTPEQENADDNKKKDDENIDNPDDNHDEKNDSQNNDDNGNENEPTEVTPREMLKDPKTSNPMDWTDKVHSDE